MYKPTDNILNLPFVIIVIQVIFGLLEVFGVIHWSIIWLLSPLWLPWVLLAFSFGYLKLFAILLYGINPKES